MGDSSADEVAAVGMRGIATSASWGIETFAVAMIRYYVAQALARAGHVARAAQLVDPLTQGAPTRDQWPAELARGGLDVIRGHLESASERLAALSALHLAWMSHRVQFAEHAALADLWCGRPRTAFDRLVAVLGDALNTDASMHSASALVLSARAAADIVDSHAAAPDERKELLRVTQALRAKPKTDPFHPHPLFASRPAYAAAWAAETTRLAGKQSLDRWVSVASEWDRLSRPHDAAYGRWRAAQTALKAGHGSASLRLIQRAARDAREHIPLLAAITQTRGHAQPRRDRCLSPTVRPNRSRARRQPIIDTCPHF